MAINETIVTGRKFRKCIDEASKLWQRFSIWTHSTDVEFEDGKNAETKVGAIDGITDSLVSTSSNIAASAKALSQVNNNLAHGQIEFDIDSDGKGYYRKTGADTWSPFSRKPLFLCTVANSDKPETKIVDLSSYLDNPSKYSANNFIIIPKSVGYYGQCYSGAGSSSYNPRNGTVDISISYDNATGNLIINGLNAGTSYNNGGFVYRGYIASFDVLFIP